MTTFSQEEETRNAAIQLANMPEGYLFKAETEDKKPEYPELWFMFDGMNTVVANFHEFGDEEDEETGYGFVLQIRDSPYWGDIYDNTREFGQKVATETDHGSVIVAPIKPEDKEKVLQAFNDIGFGAKKASDQDHEELIREMDKLSTIKGGENKKCKGKGKS